MPIVLLLGVGPAQADLAELLKHRRYVVHGVGTSAHATGYSKVDEFHGLDIANCEAVLDLARILKPTMVVSTGSDLGAATAAAVSEALSLPSLVPFSTCQRMINKGALRRQLKEAGLHPFPFCVVQPDEVPVAWDHFPAILKPVDAQGQRGVMCAANREELEEAFPAAQAQSRSSTVLVEPWCPGPEINIHLFLAGGNVLHSFVSDRNPFPGSPAGVPASHQFPSHLDDRLQRRAIQHVQNVAAFCGCMEGPVYAQLKFWNQSPFLIEISPRLDGCHLWRLIHATCGINLLECFLNRLEEKPAPVHPVHRSASSPKAIWFYYPQPGGSLAPADIPAHVDWSCRYSEPVAPTGMSAGLWTKTAVALGPVSMIPDSATNDAAPKANLS